jgi:mannose-6-phosphate isomerase
MTSLAYPLLLAPRFDAKIWGGRRLETVLSKTLPDGQRYGESLESDGDSLVLNGPMAGKTIRDLIRSDAHSLLGTRGTQASGEFGDFPLLAKFIDASDVLSVQVHPDDSEARPYGKRGKTEAWHIIAADPGATLITGVDPDVSISQVEQAIHEVRLGELVIEQPVQAGDTLLVPAGTTHAIGAGILLYEIQQASDVTYRMYDWGRLDDAGNPRKLHVSESLAVIKPGLRAERISPLQLTPSRSVLAACSYFALERWELPFEEGTIELDGGSFRLISSLSGETTIAAGHESVPLSAGQTVLIPAGTGSFTITGDGTVLVSYVPDLRQDIIVPLRREGHSSDNIAALAGALGDLRSA